MPSFGSFLCGSTGLLVSALVVLATVGPVHATPVQAAIERTAQVASVQSDAAA